MGHATKSDVAMIRVGKALFVGVGGESIDRAGFEGADAEVSEGGRLGEGVERSDILIQRSRMFQE